MLYCSSNCDKMGEGCGVTGGGFGVGAKDNNCPILKPRVACFKFNGDKR